MGSHRVEDLARAFEALNGGAKAIYVWFFGPHIPSEAPSSACRVDIDFRNVLYLVFAIALSPSPPRRRSGPPYCGGNQ